MSVLCGKLGFLIGFWNEGILPFLNSNFFNTLFGALIGTGVAAWIVQSVIEKSKNKDDLIKELNNTNAAIMLAFSICESYIGLKKQNVRPLKEEFEQQKNIFQKPNPIFCPNYSTLSIPFQPIDILQKQIFEKLSLNGLSLILFINLVRANQNLNDSTQKRNFLVEEWFKNFKDKREHPDPIIYFGLGDQHGKDERLSSCIEGIYIQTDDCIFYSKRLCEELVKHAKKLGEKIQKHYVVSVLINSPDFKVPEEKGLLPAPDLYDELFR